MSSPLQHVALVYEGADAAVEHVTELVERDRTGDVAVLVCLPNVIATAVARRAGVHDGVTFLPADRRDARPVDAMHLLWRFLQDAFAQGARRVHTIGAIELDGSAADGDWHWYERVVNDVYADTPLTATCLVDLQRVPRAAIDCLQATHEAFVGDTGRPLDAVGASSGCDESSLLPRRIELPERTADMVLLGIDRPAAARRALRDAVGGGHGERLSRAELVVSELVTNSILHGGGHADVRCWADADGITVEIADDGPGIADLMAPLRPPSLPERGAGLWTANLEATRLHVGHRVPHGTVVTARID